MLFKSIYTVNEYVLGFLPSFYGLQLLCLRSQLYCGNISFRSFLKYTERFIKDMPEDLSGKISKIIAKEFLKKKIKLTAHCLGRLVGRFGDELIEMVMERVRCALKVARAYRHSRSAVTTSMFVTVVVNNIDNVLITLYPCKYYA